MTLFNRIKTDPELQALPEFVRLLLCRLSVSEVNAATKFKKPPIDESAQEANVIKKVNEKCIELQYSKEHAEIITRIFKEVVLMAKLIQAAWQIQSKDCLEQDVKRDAALLVQAITEGKVSIKEYAPALTAKMLESLKNPQDINQLDRIAPLLLECFPFIDGEKLNHAMDSIIKEINLLKSFSNTISMLDVATSIPVMEDIVSFPMINDDIPQEKEMKDQSEDDINYDFEIIGDSAVQKGPGRLGVFGSQSSTTDTPPSIPENKGNWSCTIS